MHQLSFKCGKRRDVKGGGDERCNRSLELLLRESVSEGARDEAEALACWSFRAKRRVCRSSISQLQICRKNKRSEGKEGGGSGQMSGKSGKRCQCQPD